DSVGKKPECNSFSLQSLMPIDVKAHRSQGSLPHYQIHVVTPLGKTFHRTLDTEKPLTLDIINNHWYLGDAHTAAAIKKYSLHHCGLPRKISIGKAQINNTIRVEYRRLLPIKPRQRSRRNPRFNNLWL